MAIEFDLARRYVVSVINSYWERGYLAEWFGYECRRHGRVAGMAGDDVEAYAQVQARAPVWPPDVHAPAWNQDALLRALKFVHDHVSMPLEFEDHGMFGCTPHPRTFDRAEGQQQYRDHMNEVLAQFDPALRIAETGAIEGLVGTGLEQFLSQRPTGSMGSRYEPPITAAIEKFRRATNPVDQKDAVRDLADLLEELRPQVQAVLSNRDEADLFTIANNFAIRHRNPQQQGTYDPAVWMPWIFYWYLAAIYSTLHAVERRAEGAT